VKLKSMVDTWWKMALWTVAGIFAFLVVLGVIVGPTPAKASGDNAVKACRSSDWAPPPAVLFSRSDLRPDGIWTPHEDSPGVYSMSQRVDDGTRGVVAEYAMPPWICTAYMAKDGQWTVMWVAGSRSMGPWYVSNSDLRSVAPPRNLSGPGRRA